LPIVAGLVETYCENSASFAIVLIMMGVSIIGLAAFSSSINYYAYGKGDRKLPLSNEALIVIFIGVIFCLLSILDLVSG